LLLGIEEQQKSLKVQATSTIELDGLLRLLRIPANRAIQSAAFLQFRPAMFPTSNSLPDSFSQMRASMLERAMRTSRMARNLFNSSFADDVCVMARSGQLNSHRKLIADLTENKRPVKTMRSRTAACGDGHTSICRSLVTRGGRATPIAQPECADGSP
jgi:hypothetical protein